MTQQQTQRSITRSMKERIRTFELLGADGMATWLQESLAAYAIKQERWAFRPFELMIGKTDDLSGDLREIHDSLTSNGQAHFRIGICRTMEVLNINAELNSTWQTLIGFMHELPITEAFPILERRFSTEALDALFATDTDSYDHILSLIVEGAGFQQEAIPLIYQLVEYHLFDENAYAPHVLGRLCEIDPDHWITHIANMRTHIWKALLNDLDAKKRQRQLTRDIVHVIGHKRLEAEKHNALLVTDPRAEPNDHWFLNNIKKK